MAVEGELVWERPKIEHRKGAMLVVLATGSRAVGAVVLQKLMAVLYGPIGVTLLVHFTNLIALLTAIPTDGLNRAMKVAAGATATEDEEKCVYGYGLAIAAMAAVGLVILCAGLGFLPMAGGLIQNESNWQKLGAGLIFGIGVGLYLLGQWALTVMQARAELGKAVWMQVMLTAGGLTAVGILWKHSGSIEFLLGYWMLAQGMVSIVWVWHTKRRWVPTKLRWPTMEFWRQVGGFVVLALAIAVSGRLGDFVVRQWAIEKYSMVQTGYWQAAVKLADVAYIPVQAVLAGVLFPALTRLTGDFAETRLVARKYLLVMSVGGLVGYSALYSAGPWLLVLLNAEGFEIGSPLLRLMLPGEYLKVLALVPAYLLMGQNRPAIMLWLEFLSLGLYVGAIVLLVPWWGLAGLPMAHTLRYIGFGAMSFAAVWPMIFGKAKGG